MEPNYACYAAEHALVRLINMTVAASVFLGVKL